MKNFQKRIIGASRLHQELSARGYYFDLSESNDQNICLFTRRLESGFSVTLLFSPKDKNACSITVLIGSVVVASFYNSQKLFLHHPVLQEDRPQFLLSVDLLWLKCNSLSNSSLQCRDDYIFESERGVDRILEYLDTAAEEFLQSLSSPSALAKQLSDLASYPCRVSWGGGLKSPNPYIFSSILYCLVGDYDKATAVLTDGEREYMVPQPKLYWQEVRLRDFVARKDILLEHIHAMRSPG